MEVEKTKKDLKDIIASGVNGMNHIWNIVVTLQNNIRLALNGVIIFTLFLMSAPSYSKTTFVE